LSEFPPLELVHIITPIGATFLRQQQAQMKSVKPSTGTLKRSRGEASTTASAFGTMPTAEETFVDLTTAVDPSSSADDANPTVALPLSLRAMMESFMTNQAAHGQLLDELLTEFASLRTDFAEHKSVFSLPPPSDD